MKRIVFMACLLLSPTAKGTVIDFRPLDETPQRSFAVPLKVKVELFDDVTGEIMPLKTPSETKELTVKCTPGALPTVLIPPRVPTITKYCDHEVRFIPQGSPIDFQALVTAVQYRNQAPCLLRIEETSSLNEKDLCGKKTTTLESPSEFMRGLASHMVKVQGAAKQRVLHKNRELVAWISTLLQGDTPKNMNVRTCENALRMLSFFLNFQIQQHPRRGVSFSLAFSNGASFEILARHKQFNSLKQYTKYLSRTMRSLLRDAKFEIRDLWNQPNPEENL